MMRTRPLFVIPLLALVLGFIAVGQPAQAAAKKPSVSAKASPSSVVIQSRVTVSGKVSKHSAGATVRLQQRASGSWKTVKTTKVKRNKTYRFKVTISAAKTVLRVRVVKNTSIKAAASRSITVIGTRSSLDATRNIILQKTNEFRAKNGKRALKLMPQLNTIAQDWSVHMAATSTLAHRPNFASSYPKGWTAAGENIAAGQSVSTVVAAWIESADHRKNLLGNYNYIGIGYATGGQYGRYFTQNFAKY